MNKPDIEVYEIIDGKAVIKDEPRCEACIAKDTCIAQLEHELAEADRKYLEVMSDNARMTAQYSELYVQHAESQKHQGITINGATYHGTLAQAAVDDLEARALAAERGVARKQEIIKKYASALHSAKRRRYDMMQERDRLQAELKATQLVTHNILERLRADDPHYLEGDSVARAIEHRMQSHLEERRELAKWKREFLDVLNERVTLERERRETAEQERDEIKAEKKEIFSDLGRKLIAAESRAKSAKQQLEEIEKLIIDWRRHGSVSAAVKAKLAENEAGSRKLTDAYLDACQERDRLRERVEGLERALSGFCEFILDECDLDEQVGERAYYAAINARAALAALPTADHTADNLEMVASHGITIAPVEQTPEAKEKDYMDQQKMTRELNAACGISRHFEPFESREDLAVVLNHLDLEALYREFGEAIQDQLPGMKAEGAEDYGRIALGILLLPTAILATAAHRVLCEGQEGRDA